jgi:hypothetical protein
VLITSRNFDEALVEGKLKHYVARIQNYLTVSAIAKKRGMISEDPIRREDLIVS